MLVAAPTGAGKTVVGEFAVHLALREGRKCFYTTPIKALSNQKYNDLVARHGADRVGLLTGDNVVNGDADVVVMTTEVLRNMLYADLTGGSDRLRGLAHVVMDEVHYLADRERGAVWEEVIIHLPETCRSPRCRRPSATPRSSASGSAPSAATPRWSSRSTARCRCRSTCWSAPGCTTCSRGSGSTRCWSASPATRAGCRRAAAVARAGGPGPRRPVVSRPDVLTRLDAQGLLPGHHLHLQPRRVRRRRRAVPALRPAPEHRRGGRAGPPARREADRSSRARTCACSATGSGSRGCSAASPRTTPGCCRPSRRSSRSCSSTGLVKAVFATETLALGINMPARSVVLEKLVEVERRDARRRDAGGVHPAHRPGRPSRHRRRGPRRRAVAAGHRPAAGRRPRLDPHLPAAVELPAVATTWPSTSSARSAARQARTLLESSFAQFQADASVVGLARQISRNLEGLDGYRESMTCHLGDAEEYGRPARRAQAPRAGPRAQRRRAAPGRRGRLARAAQARRRHPRADRPPVRARRRRSTRASAARATRTRSSSPRTAGPGGCRRPTSPRRSRLSAGYAAQAPSTTARRSPGATSRPRCASSTCPTPCVRGRRRSAPPTTTGWPTCAWRCAGTRCTAATTARRTCAGPSAGTGCAARPTRWSAASPARPRRSPAPSTGCARCSTGSATCPATRSPPAGRSLARVYSESDLLAVESLRTGLWDDLSPAELAAVVSALVYSARRADESNPVVPPAPCRRVLKEMDRALGATCRELESEAGVDSCRSPTRASPGRLWRWAGGATLEQVLSDDPDMTAGDFVRWCKQVVDLLGQVALVAEDLSPRGAELRRTTRQAIEAPCAAASSRTAAWPDAPVASTHVTTSAPRDRWCSPAPRRPACACCATPASTRGGRLRRRRVRGDRAPTRPPSSWSWPG